MMQSENVADLYSALATAQASLNGAVMSGENGGFKKNSNGAPSKYATLADCWEAWKKVGPQNGLAIAQILQPSDQGLNLHTILTHKTGQWIASIYPLRPLQNTPHAMGSAITYGRRYSLCAITGIAPVEDDDDGNGASNVQAPVEIKPPRPTPQARGPLAPLATAKAMADALIATIRTARNEADLEAIMDANGGHLEKLNAKAPADHQRVVEEYRAKRASFTNQE